MDYSLIIAFCIAQVLVLMGILALRQFRNRVNILLGTILVIVLFKFIFYFFYFRGLFENYPHLIYSIRLLQALPPPFIWLYAYAIINGSIIFRRGMMLHFIPQGIMALFFIPLILDTLNTNQLGFSMFQYNRLYGLVFAELGGLLFFIYSKRIFKELRKIHGANMNLLQCLLTSQQQHLTLLKVLSIMMNVYALILIFGGFIAFYAPDTPTYFDYFDTGFLIILSYMMVFILISTPKVIHYKYSDLAKTDKLLKYERSSLSRDEAMKYMREMNSWMEQEKPYLNSSLSLGDFTEKLHLPGYIVSEVMNGLMKQNFYDYINNYRVEEFKRISQNPENLNETNLNLAFDAGFNSKTTFNTAFKKFTNKTPSEFRAMLHPVE